MNGYLRALSRAKRAAFRSGDKESYCTARVRLKGSKVETSWETRERPQHQQHQRHVAGDPDHYRLQKQECSHHVCTLYARFDFLNKDSAIKSISCPNDQPLSVSTAVRGTLLRVKVNKAAGLISVQHSTQSPPWNWWANLALWGWVLHSATGYWTFSQTDLRQFGLVTPPPLCAEHWSPPGLCA